MGHAALTADLHVVEIRVSSPNSHHFAHDWPKLGIVDSRSCTPTTAIGLIEGTVRRDDAPNPGFGFHSGQGLAGAHDATI